MDGKYAFATETYTYTLVQVKDKTEVKRKGVATSVLKKINGDWKIMISHSSSVEAVKTTSVYSCGKW